MKTIMTFKKQFRNQSKKIYFALVLITASVMLFCNGAMAQCGGGTYQSWLNWDWQYVKPSVGFPSGITFAFGVNKVSTTFSGTVTSFGEDSLHTGNGGNSINGTNDPSTDNDADFSVGNGTITFTFGSNVQNLVFSVQDIDNNQSLTVSATNAANVSQNISVATLGTSTLTVSGSGTTSATAAGGATNVLSTTNNAGATFTISSAVKTITLTFSTTGSADSIWISDMSACVTGTYAYNYQAIGKPENGQPEYFLAAGDSVCNIVNATTGAAVQLFNEPSTYGINSLAYDPVHQIVYYCDENPSIGSANHTIYKYDVKTATKSSLISDVTASPWNFILSDEGLGSGGATFYNGSLFVGVETTTDGDAAGTYRIDFASNGTTPVSACRLEAQKGADAGGSIFGYGDFVANDDTFYISNAGLTNFMVFELENMRLKNYFAGYYEQMSISSNGTVRYVTLNPDFALYTGGGTWGTPTTITGFTGTTVNDASEVFKYPADYGDSPVSYDTAYHIFVAPVSAINLSIGSTVDYEVTTLHGSNADGDDNNNTGSANDEDGVSTFPPLNEDDNSYSLTVSVKNNTGSNATLAGWIDFNQNGTYDSGERTSATVATSASLQNVVLNWTGLSGLTLGKTYIRLRIASTASEVANPKGKASNGEVEDYPFYIHTSVSGTVFDDANGLVNATVDGAGTNISNVLYANLLDDNNNVEATVNVAANGTYTFPNVKIGTHKIQLSINQGSVTNAAPATALPTDWLNTGENHGTGAGNDGTVNGLIDINVTGSDPVDFNFAIDKVPTSASQSYIIGHPVLNSSLSLTAANSMGALVGTDLEDGAKGTGDAVKIISLSGMNGNQLYYDAANDGIDPGDLLTAGTTISSYNPNLLIVKFTGNGSVNFSFNFGFLDNAGKQSPTGYSYTVSWSFGLPVTIVTFDATLNGSVVDLNWKTKTEINSDYFVIQKSTDGSNWNDLTTIDAAGNSIEDLNYSTIDPTPQLGYNYYRLKMVDLDNSFTYYHDIVAIQVANTPDVFNLYPNPATSNIFFSTNMSSNDNGTIQIISTDGKVLLQQNQNLNAGTNSISINTTTLSAGLYFIRWTGTHSNWTSSFVITTK